MDRCMLRALLSWAGETPSAGSWVLHFPYAKGEHDVPHTANDRERRHPGDEQNGTSAVVARRPEAERKFDDPADQLQPPDLDLVPGGDRDDDVHDPGEDE